MASPDAWLFRFPQRTSRLGKPAEECLFLAALASMREFGDGKVRAVRCTFGASAAHFASRGMSLASTLSAASICSTAMPP
ncbi:hypothetical protein P3T40_000289 [Paraburkholderia sp. EB58]|jgi:hypothetical protein